MINNPWTLEAVEEAKRLKMKVRPLSIIEGEEKGKRVCGVCGDPNAWYKASIRTYKCRVCGAFYSNNKKWEIV